MKGMHVRVMKSAGFPDCTNGGVTANAETVLLVGEGVEEIFEDNGRYPVLVLERRWIGGEPYVSAHPIEAAKGVGWMMGGNFIYSSDSRFPNRYPIPVHDRTESQAQYDSNFR